MKRIMIVAALVTLSGCSSTANDLRTTNPFLSGDSSKSPQAFIGCVLNNWNEKNTITPISAQPLENGYTAQINDMARGVVMLIDVMPTKDNSGSKFKFYKKRNMEYYEQSVIGCK